MTTVTIGHKSVGSVLAQAEWEQVDGHDAAGATNNSVLRGDSGGSGVQDTAVIIDDSDNMSGVVDLTMGGALAGVTSLTMSGPLSAPTTLTMASGFAISATRNMTNVGSIVATGSATGLVGITLAAGTDIDEFSTDGTLAGNSDNALPTEKAVKTYADALSFPTDWIDPWKPLVIDTDFDDQAASTSTITMNVDWTATILKGMGLKFKLSGTYYYAQISTMAAGLMTIRGAPLTTGDGDLTEMYICDGARVLKQSLFIPGAYGTQASTDTDQLADVANSMEEWDHPKAYLVYFEGAHSTAASAAEAEVNIQIANANVSTEDSNDGPTMSASVDTWVGNSVVAINTTNYEIDLGDELEIQVKAPGASTPGENLTVRAIFILA